MKKGLDILGSPSTMTELLPGNLSFMLLCSDSD